MEMGTAEGWKDANVVGDSVGSERSGNQPRFCAMMHLVSFERILAAPVILLQAYPFHFLLF
jgi:hypothetical protein